ncbi:unnamed protein product [Camellia sinensis]
MEKMNNLRSDKLKERCESNNLSFERDSTCGFSWPHRNYACSFCKKQFKSAQALGGHMNIHRRERAKLNLPQSPSWDCPKLSSNPNPNPNFSSSSSAARFLPYVSYHSSLTSFSSQSSASTDEENRVLSSGAFFGVGQLKSFTPQEDESRVLKKENIVRLDLEMGDPKEDLDLELRLGESGGKEKKVKHSQTLFLMLLDNHGEEIDALRMLNLENGSLRLSKINLSTLHELLNNVVIFSLIMNYLLLKLHMSTN